MRMPVWGAVVPLALGLMLLLLFAACGKFRQAALMMSVVPLALFGGMLALNVRGMTLNVSSAVGFYRLGRCRYPKWRDHDFPYQYLTYEGAGFERCGDNGEPSTVSVRS